MFIYSVLKTQFGLQVHLCGYFIQETSRLTLSGLQSLTIYAKSRKAYNVKILYTKTAMGHTLFTRVCVCTACVLQPFTVLHKLMRHRMRRMKVQHYRHLHNPIYSWILTALFPTQETQLNEGHTVSLTNCPTPPKTTLPHIHPLCFFVLLTKRKIQ